jgi:hypothetical protein
MSEVYYIYIFVNENDDVRIWLSVCLSVFVSVLFKLRLFSAEPVNGSGWRLYYGSTMAHSGRSKKCHGYAL